MRRNGARHRTAISLMSTSLDAATGYPSDTTRAECDEPAPEASAICNVWTLRGPVGPDHKTLVRGNLDTFPDPSRAWHALCDSFLAMNVAVPVWEERVAPVLDVANRLLLVEFDRGIELGRCEAEITASRPAERAREIADRNVNVLICGAVSWPLESMLTASGVQVIPFICGFVEDVLRAHLGGDLLRGSFRMPGCRDDDRSQRTVLGPVRRHVYKNPVAKGSRS